MANMTTQEVINYYADLLILQYLGKPKAYATVQAQVAGVIMDQLPLQVQDAFNLSGSDLAVGVQLDVLGKYAGVTRSGFGSSGPITLDDADFRKLITLAIITNTSGSSLSTIQNLLHTYFADEILLFDQSPYAPMQMTYYIDTSLGSQDLIQLFVAEGLLPHPMGVSIAIIARPVINKFFGFCSYQFAVPPSPNAPNVTPFNTYDSYDTNAPWLSYSDALT